MRIGFYRPLQRWLQRIALQSGDFWLPHVCAICYQPSTTFLCDLCIAHIPKGLRCQRCAMPMMSEGTKNIIHCQHCTNKDYHFDYSVVVMPYIDPFSGLIQQYKFNQHLLWAKGFSDLLADVLQTTYKKAPQLQPTFFTAMPLSTERLHERGFNQVHEIAKRLTCKLHIPYRNFILQREHRPAQARLPKKQRERNVRGAFFITSAGATVVKGQHVAVLDDIMTTAATLQETARVLKKAGALTVSNWVIARAEGR